MARLDLTAKNAADSDARSAADALNKSLDGVETKHAALVAATKDFNAAVEDAQGKLVTANEKLTASRDATGALLEGAVPLPQPVDEPPPLPTEIMRTRGVRLR